MAGGGHGSKAIVAALFANLGIAVAKFVGFLLTRSSALLAETVHSLALDFRGVVDTLDQAERRVRELLPIARVMYLEPDLP